MTQYSETFLCTPLPETVNGTKVTIAVLITPRLGSDDPLDATAPLSNWPDAALLPQIKPSWTVTVTQGSTTATMAGTEVSGPYDQATWDAIFPSGMEVTPYEPQDRTATPVYSYPVKTIRDTVQNLHITQMTTSPNEFASTAWLRGNDFFVPALQAAGSPQQIDLILKRDGAPLIASDLEVYEAFGLVELFHGSRLGLPVVTSVGPVDDTGTGYATFLSIHGRYLSNMQEVLFDTTSVAGFEVQSDTLITGQIPNSSQVLPNPYGSYAVRVKTSTGLSEATPFTIFNYLKGVK